MFQCYFLTSQLFFNGFPDVGTTLDGGIIGHDHTGFAVYLSDSGDDSRSWKLIFILSSGRQNREFQKGSMLICQQIDSASGIQFSTDAVPDHGRLFFPADHTFYLGPESFHDQPVRFHPLPKLQIAGLYI